MNASLELCNGFVQSARLRTSLACYRSLRAQVCDLNGSGSLNQLFPEILKKMVLALRTPLRPGGVAPRTPRELGGGGVRPPRPPLAPLRIWIRI